MKRKKNKIIISLIIFVVFVLSAVLLISNLGFTTYTTLANAKNIISEQKETAIEDSINRIVSSNAAISQKDLDIDNILSLTTDKASDEIDRYKKIAEEKREQERLARIEKEKLAKKAEVESSQNTAANETKTAPPPSSTANLNGLEAAILNLINNVRAQNGLSPLSPNQMLTDIARSRSSDMLNRNYFSHHTPDGKTIFNILAAHGVSYKNAGENLGHSMPASHGSPDAFLNAWLNSPSHRANMLRGVYTKIGIGVVDGGNRRVVTTVFLN